MTSNKPILTDICWTLYKSNTTFDFLDNTIQEKGYIHLRHFFKNPLMRKINLACLRLFRIDIQRTLALRYLKNYSQDQINQMAAEFVHNNLVNKKIDEAWNVIQGRKVVITSGTITPIAETVARETNATQIYSDDIFKDQVSDKYSHYDIITDNLSDIDLVLHAEEATIVVYHNEQKWERLLRGKKVTYIYVDDNKY